MNAVQLLLFEEDEIEVLKREHNKVKKELDKMRKSLYARDTMRMKMLDEMDIRLKIIERGICNGR